MFDKVLKPNVTQEQVYNGAAKHIVKGTVYNCFSRQNSKFDVRPIDEFFLSFDFQRQII